MSVWSPPLPKTGMWSGLLTETSTDGENKAADSTVSLLLTPGQMRVLQLNTNLSGCFTERLQKDCQL